MKERPNLTQFMEQHIWGILLFSFCLKGRIYFEVNTQALLNSS